MTRIRLNALLLPRRQCGEDGAVAVEMAIVIFPLLIVLLGIIGLGLMFWVWSTMQLAVDEGARFAMVFYHQTPSQMNSTCDEAISGGLEGCVEASVKYNIAAYRGYLVSDLSTLSVQAACYTGGYGTTPIKVKCNSTSPFPDMLAVRAGITFNLFPFSVISMAAGTRVPLLPFP